MNQAQTFGFDQDAVLLKSQVRRFLEEKFPSDRLHRLVAADPCAGGGAWDRDLWLAMVELGWHAVAVPVAAGGSGMSGAAIAGLVEEIGRAALPCPLLPTLTASFVLLHCGAAGIPALEEIAAGRSATVAITGSAGAWEVDGTEVEYRGDTLNGAAWFVQDAGKAERLLVAARGGQGLCLFWVAVDAPGVAIRADHIIDLTRDQASVRFDNVRAERICADGDAVLRLAFPAIWTMLAADIAGAAEWQLQTTVEYVSTRRQFERPLAFFQAVKHPLVDVMLQVDETRSLVYHAASGLDDPTPETVSAAHMAKASASETAAFASSRSVQYHGGIGFTWECYVHLYFKRQLHSRMLWGDGRWHRARLADLLLGPVSVPGADLSLRQATV